MIHVSNRSYTYPTDADGKMYPIKLIESQSTANKSFASVYGSSNDQNSQNKMTVLSIGGNDIKDKVVTMLLGGVDGLMTSVVNQEFVNEYETVIRNLKRTTGKIVLVSIYLPYLGPGSSYAMFAGQAKPVMKRWHSFLHKLAAKHNIPILDLSKTLDPYNRSHYGTDIIYLSNTSSSCVAKCIQYIYDNYDGYHIYYAPDCSVKNIKCD